MATSLHSCGMGAPATSRGLGTTRPRSSRPQRGSLTVVGAWGLPKVQLPKLGGKKKAKDSKPAKGGEKAKPEPEKKKAPARKSLNITEGSYTVMGSTRKRNEDRFQTEVWSTGKTAW